MILKSIKYQFKAKLWQHSATGGWYFVSIPEELSDEIRKAFKSEEEGWGRLKARARIGESEWKTAIWYDTKLSCYLLPVKAEIRKKEQLEAGKSNAVLLWL